MSKEQTPTTIKHLAVLTSGGDAPGMNAAIRSVVRTAISYRIKVSGVIGGFFGLMEGHFVPLELNSVANILQRGGTILKSGRCLEFHNGSSRTRAAEQMRKAQIDALVCIGGDGTFHGARALAIEHSLNVVGIPGTIDNDIFGSDYSIGFDTAINTALEAIDRIRDTAASHDRLFIVEVMGRDSGFIACAVGLAGGAEEVFMPDSPQPIDQVIKKIKRGQARGKMSSILISAEGQKPGRAYDLAESLRKKAGLEAKVCILGHIQRGGSPSAADRILASRLGSGAVQALLAGQSNGMAAVQSHQIVFVPFAQSLGKKKAIAGEMMELVRTLSI